MSWLIAILLFLALHWTHRTIENKLNDVITHQRKIIRVQRASMTLLTAVKIRKEKSDEDRNDRA